MTIITFQKKSVHTKSPNTQITISEFAKLVQTGEHAPVNYEDIAHYADVFEQCASTEDRDPLRDKLKKEVKPKIDPIKNSLPWIVCSGWVSNGHKNDDVSNFNGLIQVDLDFKIQGGRVLAREVINVLKTIPFIVLAGLSPSKRGVKAFAQTSTVIDEYKHAEHASLYEHTKNTVLDAITKKVYDAIQINLDPFTDRLPIAQPCFYFSDPDCYFNDTASPFEVPVYVPPAPKKQPATLAHIVATPYTQIAHDGFIRGMIQRAIARAGHWGTTATVRVIRQLNSRGLNKFEIEQALLSLAPQTAADDIARIGPVCKTYQKEFNTNPFTKSVQPAKQTENITVDRATTLEPFYELPVGGRLSDLGFKYLDDSQFPLHTKIIASTGIGKTYDVIRQEFKRVMVVPTLALAAQILEEAKTLSPYGAVEFNSRNQNVSNDHNFIVTTYASCAKLISKIDPSQYVMFLDEAHKMVTNMSFQSSQVMGVRSTIDKWKKVIQLTATDVCNTDSTFTPDATIRVQVAREYTQEVIGLYTDNQFSQVVDLAKSSVAANETVVIYLNNTKEDGDFGDLKAALEQAQVKFTAVNSRTVGDDGEVDEVVIKGDASGCGVILATCIFAEGISVTNHNPSVTIIFVGEWGATDIAQASHRMRKASRITCVKFFPTSSSKHCSVVNDYEEYVGYIKEGARITCLGLNMTKNITEILTAATHHYVTNVNLKNQGVYFNRELDEFVVDDLWSSWVGYTFLRVKESNDPIQMQLALNRYGLRLKNIKPECAPADETVVDETAAAIKSHRDSLSDVRLDELIEVVGEIKIKNAADPIPTIEVLRHRSTINKKETPACKTSSSSSTFLSKMRETLKKAEDLHVIDAGTKEALAHIKKVVEVLKPAMEDSVLSEVILSKNHSDEATQTDEQKSLDAARLLKEAQEAAAEEKSKLDQIHLVKVLDKAVELGFEVRRVNQWVNQQVMKKLASVPEVKAIFDSFVVGETYTSEYITKVMQDHANNLNHVYTTNSGTEKGHITPTKAVQMLNWFYKVKRTKKDTPSMEDYVTSTGKTKQRPLRVNAYKIEGAIS